MPPRAPWHEESKLIEIGVRDAAVALALRHEGCREYLGVSPAARRIATLQARHPELADQLACAKRPRLVLYNNADVLILSGAWTAFVWKFRSVRHAQVVAWRCGLGVFSLVALAGCLWHMISRRYSRPRVVTLRAPGGQTRRLFVCRVLKRKNCYRNALHFIPHGLGLRGLFRQFDEQGVEYVVLRWFESLPEIGPADDVDLLVDDRSLAKALAILDRRPGIQACDVYSETGLARSDYCGTPYYPRRVARRLLDGAVRHHDLCPVPNRWDYFHSLAYHAVYHKGLRSGLPRGETGLPPKGKPGHDYTGILRDMAARLDIDVDVSLEGLHAYLQANNWGPSPEMLARLAAACSGNRWLRLLVNRLGPDVHDQGLTVFVLREQAVKLGFQDKMVRMIEQSGFEILAMKMLTADEAAYAAARTRGGNWGTGPFATAGGPPAVAVVAYDRDPLPPNRKQRRKFPQRTNARIFVKELIRDAVLAELPPGEGCNALHSSDHAAEAWHLIEVLAPELAAQIQARLHEIRQPAAAARQPVEPGTRAVADRAPPAIRKAA